MFMAYRGSIMDTVFGRLETLSELVWDSFSTPYGMAATVVFLLFIVVLARSGENA